MTDLDLTEAVEAAAQALFRHQYPDACGTWDDVMPMTKHTLREIVLPLVSAAVPHIAAQVRAEVRALLEAAADREHAGGCYYRHQQGETSECNSCAAARIENAILAASPAPTEEADRG